MSKKTLMLGIPIKNGQKHLQELSSLETHFGDALTISDSFTFGAEFIAKVSLDTTKLKESSLAKMNVNLQKPNSKKSVYFHIANNDPTLNEKLDGLCNEFNVQNSARLTELPYQNARAVTVHKIQIPLSKVHSFCDQSHEVGLSPQAFK